MSKPNLPGALRAMHAGLAALHDGQMSLTMKPEQWGLLLAAADELERKPPPPFYRLDINPNPSQLEELRRALGQLEELRRALEVAKNAPPPPLIVVAGMPLEIIQPTTPNQAKMVEAIGQALAHRDCLPDAVGTKLENALKGDA